MSEPDPITAELFRNGINALGDEMALTIYRTAYSGVLKNIMDYSTAICDGEGRLVAQGLSIAGHLCSIPVALKACLRRFGSDIAEGDIFALNDPYEGGMHLPDIFVFRPVFVGDRPLAWACTICHHTDVGGRVPGSNASDSTEIYAEGLRIPPLKLYERGRPNATLFRIIERNVRVPGRVLGDIRAQLAACEIAARGLAELIARHGAEEMVALMEATMAHSERLTRHCLAELPDGEASFTDWIDDDQIDAGKPIKLFCTVRKQGERMWIDWTGTAPQVKGAINNTWSYTAAASFTAAKSVLSINMPNNDGVFRADQSDRAAGHDRQRAAAGRLRRARPHRLPHGRLLLRRARHAVSGSRDGGLRGRQHRGDDRRLRCRAPSRSSTSISSPAPGAAGPGPTGSKATPTCSPIWRAFPSR